jgi:hypothetical protein
MLKSKSFGSSFWYVVTVRLQITGLKSIVVWYTAWDHQENETSNRFETLRHALTAILPEAFYFRHYLVSKTSLNKTSISSCKSNLHHFNTFTSRQQSKSTTEFNSPLTSTNSKSTAVARFSGW